MKNVITILFIIFIVACSNDNNSMQEEFVLNVGVKFNLLNEDGSDLLNSNTLNFFPVENMKLYYEINGEKVEVYDENMDLPRNIGLNMETTPYQIGIASYSGYEGEISETNGIKSGISIAYLELNNVDTDTIKVEWECIKDKYFINKKVWYNGKLHEPAEIPFVVIK